MSALRYFSKSFSANERLRISQVGALVRCLSGAAVFAIEPDEQNSVQIQEGISIRYQEKFKSIVIVNGSTAQTISVYIGDGDIDDSRIYGTINVKNLGADTCTNAVDGSLDATDESTIAANTTRRRLVIQADIDNTGELRIGPVVSDTRGFKLTPGASQEFLTTSAITIRNATGGASGEKFTYFEESYA